MIRVFVGTDSIQQDAEKVLEYSIQKNTAEDVDLTFMRPGWQTPPTGFASHRFMIPRLCQFKGFAIYLDVDMLVLGDLSELWKYRTKKRWCITLTKTNNPSSRDEVSVIDCSAFRDLPSEDKLRLPHGKSMAKSIIGDRYLSSIPYAWNSRVLAPCTKHCCALRGEVPDKIPVVKLIHYTNLETQPWHPDSKMKYKEFPCKRTKDLFFEYLEAANNEL